MASVNIDLIVLNGAYGRSLAFGPAYAEASAFPGTAGATILTGHRDTHFRFLRDLQMGQVLTVETASRKLYRYRIRERRIVSSSDATIALDATWPRLVLITCYPFDSLLTGGPLRYVVTADLKEG
jgi:sortase A